MDDFGIGSKRTEQRCYNIFLLDILIGQSILSSISSSLLIMCAARVELVLEVSWRNLLIESIISFLLLRFSSATCWHTSSLSWLHQPDPVCYRAYPVIDTVAYAEVNSLFRLSAFTHGDTGIATSCHIRTTSAGATP